MVSLMKCTILTVCMYCHHFINSPRIYATAQGTQSIIISITQEQSVSDSQEIKQLYSLEILVLVQRIELGTGSSSSKDTVFNATHLIVTLLQLSVVRSIEKLSVFIQLQFPVFSSELDLICPGVLYSVKLESAERLIWICRDPGGFPTFPVQLCDKEFSPSTRLGLSESVGFFGLTVREQSM